MLLTQSPYGFSHLSLSIISSMNTQQIQALVASQISSMTPAQLGVLTGDQLAKFSAKQMSQFTDAQMAFLTPSAWAKVPPANFQRMWPEQFMFLTASQVAAMTRAQLQSLDLGRMSLLNVSELSITQLNYKCSNGGTVFNALTKTQFASLGSDQLTKLSLNQLSGLSSDFLNSLSVEKIAHLNLSLINADKFNGKDSQGHTLFSKLSADQINNIDKSSLVKVSAIAVSELTTNQLSKLTVDTLHGLHVEKFNATQLTTLDSSNHLIIDDLTLTQISTIDSKVISTLSSSIISNLSNEHLHALTGSQVSQLTAAQIQSLSAEQIKTLDTSLVSIDQLHNSDANGNAVLLDLSMDQLQHLNTTIVSALSHIDISSLSVDALHAVNSSGFTNQQLSLVLSTGTTLLENLSFTQLENLSGSVVSSLTSNLIALLTTQEIDALASNNLTTDQLSYIDASGHSVLKDLTNQQISNVSTSALKNISADTLSTLDATQLSALTEKQVEQLSSDQLTVLNQDQLHALNASLLSFSQLFTHDINDKFVLNDLTANQLHSIGQFSAISNVLNNFSSTIDSSKGLDQEQFNELKTYVSSIKATDGSQSYEYYIINALVNGNAFNKTWTGGVDGWNWYSSSISLGNLGVGSSKFTFDKLVDKWIDGLDNPKQDFVGVLYVQNMPHYTVTDAPLFKSGGPSADDVNQGAVGDCYFLAALADVAYNNPDYIKSMIWSNGDGTYGVKFYDTTSKLPVYVTVDGELNQYAAGWGDQWTWYVTGNGAAWVSLVEKAYVEYTVITNQNTFIGQGQNNSYNSIYGGFSKGLVAITGMNTKNYSSSSYSSETLWEQSLQNYVTPAIQNKLSVMYASNVDSYDTNGKQDLISGHIFSVLGVDSTNGNLILRNPWGNRGTFTNETFEISDSNLWANGRGGAFVVSNGYLPSEQSSTLNSFHAVL